MKTNKDLLIIDQDLKEVGKKKHLYTKQEIGDQIFNLFNSDHISLDSCFSKNSIESFLKIIFGNKEVIKNGIEKIINRCLVVDLILDEKNNEISVELVTRGNSIKILDENLFLMFCKLHTLLPWIRKIYINTKDKDVLLNHHGNLSFHYQLLFQLVKDIRGIDYFTMRNICDECFNGNSQIFIFLKYIEDIKGIWKEVIQTCSLKMVNRSIFEILFAEVFYKNKKNLKKSFTLSNLHLASFQDDHEKKIDNYISFIHPLYGSRKIGIQLTSFDSINRKISSVLPFVESEMIIMGLNDGLECLVFEGETSVKLSKRLTYTYDNWLKNWLKRGKNTGHFPFFVYRVENEIEDLIYKNIKIILKFINQCLFDKVFFLDKIGVDKLKLIDGNIDKDLIDGIIKYLNLRLDHQKSSLELDFNDYQNDLIFESGSFEKVGKYQNKVQKKILKQKYKEKEVQKKGNINIFSINGEGDKLVKKVLVIRGKIKNHGVSIGEMVYLVNL